MPDFNAIQIVSPIDWHPLSIRCSQSEIPKPAIQSAQSSEQLCSRLPAVECAFVRELVEQPNEADR